MSGHAAPSGDETTNQIRRHRLAAIAQRGEQIAHAFDQHAIVIGNRPRTIGVRGLGRRGGLAAQRDRDGPRPKLAAARSEEHRGGIAIAQGGGEHLQIGAGCAVAGQFTIHKCTAGG